MAAPAAVLSLLVTANTTPANAALAGTQKQLLATATTAKKSGIGMSRALAGVGVAAGAAAVGLYKVGEAFDDASDKIRTQTGASGKELKKLERNFRSVVRTVPADFDSASDAIAGLNQRLNLSGRPLVRLSRQMTELSRITETDVGANVKSVSRLFGDWGVETNKQTKTLDKLYRASQETGIQVSELSDLMVQFGSPLRQLGLDFDTAAAMFSRFEKEGVNIQTLMPGLKYALKNFSQPTTELSQTFKQLGIDLREGPSAALREVFEALKDAPSDLKANALAFEVFGARAGPDMAAAVREGRFELDKLAETIKTGDDTIRKAGRQTMDFSEHWQKFKNNVLLALEPVAKRVFTALGDAMKDVTKVMSDPSLTNEEKLKKLTDLVLGAVNDLIRKAGELAPKIAQALAEGLLNAPVWTKLAAATWIVKAMGGFAKLKAMGATAGKWIGRGLGVGILAGLLLMDEDIQKEIKKVLEKLKETVTGELLDATPKEDFAHQLAEWFKVGGEDLEIGRNKVAVATAFGRLVFNAETQKLVKAGNKKLKDLIGLGVQDVVTELNSPKYERMFDPWGKGAEDAARDVSRASKDVSKSVGRVDSAMKDSSSSWARETGKIKSNTGGLVGAIGKGMKAIVGNTNSALKAFGVKSQSYISFEAGRADLPQNARGGLHHLQRGAMVPGSAPGDRHVLALNGIPIAKVESGEKIAVVNREAAKAEMALNASVPRFQKGGMAGNLTRPFNVDGAQPGFVPFMNFLNSMFGPIYVMSGNRPGSITTSGNLSNHSGGHAVDISTHGIEGASSNASLDATGPLAQRMDALHSYMARNIPTSKVSGDFLWRTMEGGNHFNHIHRGITNGLESDPQAMVQFLLGLPGSNGMAGGLPKVGLKGPGGPLLKLGQAALAKVQKAAEDYLSSKASTPMFGTGKVQKIPHAGGRYTVDEMAQLWTSQRGPRSQAHTAGAVGMAESMGDPNAYNPSGASGLWQILGQVVPGDIFDPIVNAKNAVKKYTDAGGWSPWVAYTSGVYQQYMQKGGVLELARGGLAGLFPQLGARKPSKRRKALGDIMDRIKGLGLNEKTFGRLGDLSKEVAVYQEYADRAASLNTDTALGLVGGKNEAQWLGSEGNVGVLQKLFNLREVLLNAEAQVSKRMETVGKMVEVARKRFERVAKFVRDNEKKIKANADQQEQVAKQIEAAEKILADEKAKPKKKQSAATINTQSKKIDDLKKKLVGLKGQRADLVRDGQRSTRERDLLKSKVIPAMTGKQGSLIALRGELLGFGGDGFIGLEDVQGLGSPLKHLAELPELGVLGGQIFTTQNRLRELGLTATATASGGLDDTTSGQVDILRELLREANLRTAVSQAQYDVLARTPYMGAFASGGVALVGENGPELAHLPSGTRIHSNEETQQMLTPTVVVNGDIVQAPGDTRPPIEVQGARAIVQQGSRGIARRPLTSARGY